MSYILHILVVNALFLLTSNIQAMVVAGMQEDKLFQNKKRDNRSMLIE